MKNLFKRSLSVLIAVIVLMISCLSVFAENDGYQGKYYSEFERAKCVVTRTDLYEYAGYTGGLTPQTFHYYINDRTAYCVWSKNPSATPVTATLGKYIMPNSNKRSKAIYYLGWASTKTSPDKTTNGYYDTISSSFLTAYKNTVLADYTTLTKSSTYQDVILAALKYVIERNKAYSTGENAGTSGPYQYCMSHTLLDYLQQKEHNGGIGWYWKEAIEALDGLIDSLPNVPSEYRAFYIYPSGDSEQSLMSIEKAPVTTGYLKITKKSSDTSVTSGNSYYSLKGAVYTVYSNLACTTKVTSLTTGSNGTVTSGEIKAGTYYVKETTAPKGYALDKSVHKVTISADKTTSLSVSDAPEVGYAKIVKTSSNPELTDKNDCYSLEGAVFTVYTDAACTKQHSTLTTGADGTITSGKMVPGTYYVKETTAPKGYALDSTIHKITVSAGDTVTLNISDNPQYDPVAVILQKRNATTGETTDVRLAGAEYTFNYYNAFYSTKAELNWVTPTRSWVLKTNESGYCELGEDWLVSGDAFYYVSTEGSTERKPMLPLGTLTIKETKAPDGFYLDETLYIQQITSVGQDVFVNTYNTPTSDEYEIPKVSVSVTKTWDDDNNRDGLRPTELTYTLFADGVATQSVTVTEEDNWSYTFTDLYKTTVDKVDIVYTIEETAVENYKASYSDAIFNEENSAYTINITNKHEIIKTEKTVYKYWEDFSNAMGYRPQSIKVSLFANEKIFATGILSDNTDWKYLFSDLPVYYDHGKVISYMIKEEPIDGYTTSIDGLQVVNTLVTGTVTLNKTDGSDTPLEGVEFELYTADDKLVYCSENSENYSFYGLEKEPDATGTFKTNSDGQIIVVDLPYGEYYFKETKTLDEYMPYNKDIPFEISKTDEEGRIVSVDIQNNKIVMYNTGGFGDRLYCDVALAISFTGAFFVVLYYKKYTLRKKEKLE